MQPTPGRLVSPGWLATRAGGSIKRGGGRLAAGWCDKPQRARQAAGGTRRPLHCWRHGAAAAVCCLHSPGGVLHRLQATQQAQQRLVIFVAGLRIIEDGLCIGGRWASGGLSGGSARVPQMSARAPQMSGWAPPMNEEAEAAAASSKARSLPQNTPQLSVRLPHFAQHPPLPYSIPQRQLTSCSVCLPWPCSACQVRHRSNASAPSAAQG